MSRGVQVSLWLEKDLKRLVEDREINLTRWVNDTLRKFLSVSTTEEIDNKIKELRSELTLLERKRADFVVEQKMSETGKMLDNAVLEDLKRWYIYRRNNEAPEAGDRDWIRSPSNLERCELLGKTPDQVLMELKGWYDGLQKDHD